MTTQTTPPPAISPTLDELLDAELAFSTVYQRYYASHLSMSLVALEALGAPPSVLEETFAAHERRATPREDPAAVDAVRAEIARDSIEATVRARTPGLVDAPGTQLFHAVIRLAYALDANHEGQVAASLVDWDRLNRVLPAPEPTRGSRRVDEVLALLGAQTDVAESRHSIRELDAIVRLDGFRRSVAEVAIDEHTLDDVATLTLHAHVAADDFFTLHMVTGAHAVRVVSEHLDDAVSARLAARTVQVMAAAYLGVGAPTLAGPEELDAIRRSALPTWDEIAAAAVADRDAHVVKLTYVSRAEHRRTGDPLYQYVAARVVGLTGERP